MGLEESTGNIPKATSSELASDMGRDHHARTDCVPLFGEAFADLSFLTVYAFLALLKVQFPMLTASRHSPDPRLPLSLDFGRRQLMDLGDLKHLLKRWLAAKGAGQVGDAVSPGDCTFRHRFRNSSWIR